MIGTMWCSQWEKNGNVLDEHDVVIAGDFLEGAAEFFFGVLPIAREQLLVGLDHALGGVEQAFPGHVIANPAQQRANGFFGFGLGRAGCRFLARKGF
jgi:hypothetical protein